MIFNIISILNSVQDLNGEFEKDRLLGYLGKPTDIKYSKSLVIYRYDYLEVTYMDSQIYSIMFDDMNYINEKSNTVICKMLKPLLEIKISNLKTLLDEHKIAWELNLENTFRDQVCLKTKSGWLIYFNKNDEIIRSALYQTNRL